MNTDAERKTLRKTYTKKQHYSILWTTTTDYAGCAPVDLYCHHDCTRGPATHNCRLDSLLFASLSFRSAPLISHTHEICIIVCCCFWFWQFFKIFRHTIMTISGSDNYTRDMKCRRMRVWCICDTHNLQLAALLGLVYWYCAAMYHSLICNMSRHYYLIPHPTYAYTIGRSKQLHVILSRLNYHTLYARRGCEWPKIKEF
jgi:hypothetical protein